MRALIVALALLGGLVPPATAQLSLSFAIPGASLGINVPQYPELVQVPGHPVYYAPRLRSNYFFYDGLYWVFQGDNWYASNWYDGPWGSVGPAQVPAYVLRLPVRYYRSPPRYFQGWRRDAAPRWGEHWGPAWQQQRQGWDRWDRRAVPAPAPRPLYQRSYSGSRYPLPDQQHLLQQRNYRHQPRDEVVRRQLPAPAQHVPDQHAPRQAPPQQQRQEPRRDHGRDVERRDQGRDQGRDGRRDDRREGDRH